MNSIKLPLALSALILSSQAFADKLPSYRFVELGYSQISFDESDDIKPTGFKLNGAFEITKYFYAVGNYSRTSDKASVEGESYDLDLDMRNLGIGGKYDQFDGLSWFAEFTVGEWELADLDFDVNTLRLGFRAQMSESFEINASYTTNEIKDSYYDEELDETESFKERENGYQIGIVYEFLPTWHAGISYDTVRGNFDMSQTSLSVRKSF